MQKRKVVFGILSFILIFFAIYFFIWWFIELGFDFAPDVNNLADQADGLAYSITVLIVLIYLFSGFFLLMEGKVSEIEVQKKFHYSLSVLFIFLGLAQGSVALYSILKSGYSAQLAISIMPDFGLLARGDVSMAFSLATLSAVLIIYNIEKFILNSKKFILTILMVLGAIGAFMTLAGMYVEGYLFGGVTATPMVPDWWKYYGYGSLILMIIGVGITLIALPVIYFRLAVQTSGDLRKNSSTIAIGYLLTFVMVVLHMLRSDLFDQLPLNWVIFLFGNFVGAMILLAGYLKSTY